MLKKSVVSEFVVYLLAVLVTTIVFVAIFCPHGLNLSVPLLYHKEMFWTAANIKMFLHESGSYLYSPNLGAPGFYDGAAFPVSEGATFFIIKLLNLLFNNYIVIMNVFYYLTYLLCVIISLAVFRVFGLNRPWAFVASILYTFIPYHLLRGESHLLLTTYYIIPLYMLLIKDVFPLILRNTAEIGIKSNPSAWLIQMGYILLAIFAASSGIYYACFAVYFLVIAGVLRAVELGQWRAFTKAAIYIVVILATVFINTLPTQLEKHKYGTSEVSVNRNPGVAEEMGLKMTQLVLPVDGHHLPGLRKSKKHYNNTAPLVTENRSASLGLVGAIGFLALLAILLWRDQTISRTLFLCSRLNIFAVLFGTVGGFGALFAYTVSPMIRGLNRISIFIAFFALLGLCLLLQRVSARYSKGVWLIAVGVVVVGLCDQIPLTQVFYRPAQIQALWSSDDTFAHAIEAQLPPNSMVFQLPFMRFPENGYIYRMWDYEQFRPYLHTTHLKWSYGAMKGRVVASWQDIISQQPLPVMLQQLAYAGFAGIYLDRQGYPEHGKQIEQELVQYLRTTPLVSPDQRFIFFSLKNYVVALKAKETVAEWQDHVNEVKILTTHPYTLAEVKSATDYRTGQGFGSLQRCGKYLCVASQAQSVIQLNNPLPIPVIVQYRFIVTATHENSKLQLALGGMEYTIHLQHGMNYIDNSIIIPSGQHQLLFHLMPEQENHFTLINFKLIPVSG